MADFNQQGMNFGGAGMSAPQVNPYAYPSEYCEECGSEVFVPGVIFKKVPGVLLGQGVDIVPVPVKVAVCAKCGTMSALDRQRLDEETQKAKKAEEASKKSSLII